MKQPKHQRILAIAPSTKGFGFAVFESPAKLVDRGVKSASGDKSADSLAKADALMAHYLPTVLVLEDHAAPGMHRRPRIHALCTGLAALATLRKVKLRLLTRTLVRRTLLGEDAPGTKQMIAEVLAERFPDLGPLLPPKRKLWMSQDYSMDIFDAVALALVCLPPKDRNAPAEVGAWEVSW